MARGQTRDNGEGVLVDTIHYESTGVTLTDVAAKALAEEGDDLPDTTVGQVKIPVEIRLRKAFKDGGGTNRAVTELQFSLVCRKPKIVLRGPDIEILRAAMWAELDKDSAIVWEEYILVTIEPALAYGEGTSEGLRLQEETVYKGTTRGGLNLLRQYGRNRLDLRDWTYRPWPSEFTDRRGKVTACIPATPANQAAMEEFRDRIRKLRAMLQGLVKPQEIMRTLSNLSGIELLAAPEDAA